MGTAGYFLNGGPSREGGKPSPPDGRAHLSQQKEGLQTTPGGTVVCASKGNMQAQVFEAEGKERGENPSIESRIVELRGLLEKPQGGKIQKSGDDNCMRKRSGKEKSIPYPLRNAAGAVIQREDDDPPVAGFISAEASS